jgi:DNA-directed RNA polymerase subunit RPC12/RpoP
MREFNFKCYKCKRNLGTTSIPPLKCPYCGSDQVGINDEIEVR